RMLASVRQMVVDFKDEPYILMWILGNENENTGSTHTNANAQQAAYTAFVEQAAQLIKSLDSNHPVACSLLDIGVLDQMAANAPHVDIIGANVYRYSGAVSGADPGVVSYFTDVKNTHAVDKPVLFTEYGDIHQVFNGTNLDTTRQQQAHATTWNAIVANEAGAAGTDTAIGGFAFEWVDNWWQNGGPTTHDIVGSGSTNNEWHGIFSQGAGNRSPFLRQMRPVYQTYQGLWNPSGASRVTAAGGRFLFSVSGATVFVDVPPGAFPAGASLSASTASSFPSGTGTTLDVSPTGQGLTITEASGLQPAKTLTVYFPFNHNGGKFVLARFDTTTGQWVPLKTSRDAAGYLIAETPHLTLFQAMQVAPSSSASRVLAYPNPARPAIGHTSIAFTQIPPGSRVRLFNIAGEEIRDIDADNVGAAYWDLRNADHKDAASGVYFAVIDGSGGKQVIKVAVQR
ncbi:MAG: hypothetical protein JO102_00385, partial [Elusimicrobia bacterium]|nr:hypothetical protein [Elusimicrobiota bacterium]